MFQKVGWDTTGVSVGINYQGIYMIKVRGELKKNGIFWEFFPKWGGVTPIPKTFVQLPSHFWHAKFILRC